MQAQAIDAKLTAMGKDERALSVSGHVYTDHAFNKAAPYKQRTKNHLMMDQIDGFRIGDKDGKTIFSTHFATGMRFRSETERVSDRKPADWPRKPRLEGSTPRPLLCLRYHCSPGSVSSHGARTGGLLRRLFPQLRHVMRGDLRSLTAETRRDVVGHCGDFIVGIGVAECRHRQRAVRYLSLGS
jgi:hypothetical protein